MSTRVCPWWLGWLLASPLRRLLYDPARVLAPFVRDGMVVLEPGPGMGFLTLEAARRVGDSGRVVAVDLQERMLAGLRRRAERAGVAARVDARLARSPEDLGVADLAGKVDFVLAFAVVHELPDAGRFFAQLRPLLAPGARILLAEPRGHVREAAFRSTLDAARAAGLRVDDQAPGIASNWTAVLSAAAA